MKERELQPTLTIPMPPGPPCLCQAFCSTGIRSCLMKSTPLLRAVREFATRRTRPRVYKHLTADTPSLDNETGSTERLSPSTTTRCSPGTSDFPPKLLPAGTVCNGEKRSRANCDDYDRSDETAPLYNLKTHVAILHTRSSVCVSIVNSDRSSGAPTMLRV